MPGPEEGAVISLCPPFVYPLSSRTLFLPAGQPPEESEAQREQEEAGRGLEGGGMMR